MSGEKAEKVALSPENFAHLRGIIAKDITKLQDALSDSSQNPTIHQQLDPIISQNKKILASLDTIMQDYAANPAEAIRVHSQKYASIVNYVLRNHPNLDATLLRTSSDARSSERQEIPLERTDLMPIKDSVTSARNSVEEFSINTLSLKQHMPRTPDNNLHMRSSEHNNDGVVNGAARQFVGSVDMIRSSISSTHSIKAPERPQDMDSQSHVAASVSSLHAPSIMTNARLHDIANGDISLFSLATLASLEGRSNEWTLLDPSPMRSDYALKARDSPVPTQVPIASAPVPVQQSPLQNHNNVLASIYTAQGNLIDPCPHHSRQVLYELAKRYKEQAEILASRTGSMHTNGSTEAKIANLVEENSALKVSLHSALNELTDLKQKLTTPSQRTAMYEGSLSTENMSLKETIARKNCELIKQGQELKETRNIADDLQKTKSHLTHLTDVLLEERKMLQDELLSLKPGGKESVSTKEIESMCKHIAALEKQLHTDVAGIEVGIVENLSTKLKSTISIYEQMLMKIKQRAIARPQTPDIHNTSANLSIHAFSPYASSSLAVASPGDLRSSSFGRYGGNNSTQRRMSNIAGPDDGYSMRQSMGGPASRPGSARTRTTPQPPASRSASGKRPLSKSATATNSSNISRPKSVSPEVLTYEVVKILTEMGPRAPSLQRIGPREWIVEKTGTVISINLAQNGTVVIESEGGVPLIQYLKRMQDPPTRTTTPRRVKSPRHPTRDDDLSISKRSPGIDTSGLSMFSAAKRMMTHQI